MNAEYVLEKLLIVIGLHGYTTFWMSGEWGAAYAVPYGMKKTPGVGSPRFTDLPNGERVWWLIDGSRIMMTIAPIPESSKTTENEFVVDLADPLSFSKIKKIVLGKPMTDEEIERMERPIGECHA